MFVAVSSVVLPRVSIIIAAQHAMAPVVEALRSLSTCPDLASFEIVVVADADVAGVLSELVPAICVVPAESATDLPTRRQLGVAAARGELLVFQTAGTSGAPDWLDALCRAMDDDPTVGQVGSLVVDARGLTVDAGGIAFSDGRTIAFGAGQDPRRPELRTPRDVDFCPGACFAIRAELFSSIGGFDRRFVSDLYADIDLSFAVRARGSRTVLEPDSLVMQHTDAPGPAADARRRRFAPLDRQVFVTKWHRAIAGNGGPESAPDIWRGCQRSRRGMFLICEPDVPEPNRDSGSRRLSALVDAIQDLGFAVYFIAANERELEPYTRDLRRRGVTVFGSHADQRRFISEAGSQLQAVMLCRPGVAHKYLEDIFRYCPDTLVLFDTVDLHALRAKRQAKIEGSRTASRLADFVWLQERAAIQAADTTFVVSTVEQQILAEELPEARVEILSNVHLPVVLTPELAARTGMTFVGNFRHQPNLDAAHWFVGAILPLIRAELPDAFVRLVGSHMPPEISLLGGDGVQVVGWAPEMAPIYLGTRLVVAPLRYGAGVKGKVLEALEHAVPVVATPVAAEGLFVGFDDEVTVRPDAAQFAQACVRLLTDDARWRAAAGAGRSTVLARFSPALAAETLARVLRVVPIRRTVPLDERLGATLR